MDELIPEALAGERLDRVVALLADVSRSVAATAIAEGDVLVDGEMSSRARRVDTGQRLSIAETVGAPKPRLAGDPATTVATLHVDDDVIVVDKAAGQVVHPGAGQPEGTVVQGLLAHFPELAGVGERHRPGIVHRLDKGTSGVFVVARSPHAHAALSDQLQARTVGRRYLALVWGRPESDRGLIDAPLGRAGRDPTRVTVRTDGKTARTSYEVLASWDAPAVTLVACVLETGRTHQIRAHMTAIGHPVVGDVKYGGSRAGVDFTRPALHAAELTFDHPSTGARLTFTSPLPEDLALLFEGLGPPDQGAVPTTPVA